MSNIQPKTHRFDLPGKGGNHQGVPGIWSLRTKGQGVSTVCLEQGLEGIDVAVESRPVDGAVGAGVCLWVLDVGEEGGREGGMEGGGGCEGRTDGGRHLCPPTSVWGLHPVGGHRAHVLPR